MRKKWLILPVVALGIGLAVWAAVWLYTRPRAEELRTLTPQALVEYLD